MLLYSNLLNITSVSLIRRKRCRISDSIVHSLLLQGFLPLPAAVGENMTQDDRWLTELMQEVVQDNAIIRVKASKYDSMLRFMKTIIELEPADSDAVALAKTVLHFFEGDKE